MSNIVNGRIDTVCPSSRAYSVIFCSLSLQIGSATTISVSGLLLRISHKLVRYNPVYDFVYTNAYNKYSSLNTNEEHIEAMARRIVIKKFLQNLFTHWIKLED